MCLHTYDCLTVNHHQFIEHLVMSGPEQSVRPVRQMPDHFSEAIPQSKSLS